MAKNFGIFSTADYAGTDQGVDFRGSGQIPALDNALVTDVGTTSIVEEPGKTYNYVIYRLQSGVYKGHFVYTAENFQPVVHVGQNLKKGQEVGIAQGSYPYIETGFNKSEQGWNAFGNLNGPQPAGEAMKNYIYSILGAAPSISNADPRATNTVPGNATPSKIVSSLTGDLTGGITAFLYQALFVIVGLGFALVGLFLIARALMAVGAPNVVKAIERRTVVGQTRQRLGQTERRISESERAGIRSQRRLEMDERRAELEAANPVPSGE